MKSSLLVSIALLIAKAAVQATGCLDVAVAEIPPCAQPCFLDDATLTGCNGSDFACQCQKEAILYAAVEPCVASGCPEASFQAVIDGASSVCNCATASPRTIGVGNSLGSFKMVPTAVVSGTILNTVIDVVPGTVTGSVISTAINSPATSSATSTPATPSPSQNAAPNHQIDPWNGPVANIAVLALLAAFFL
ncbi:hypothetical protein GGR53DRAFT_465924 [Hypoxylon sp. FL1150]|nr:hypothetical protein GGR53DRAFT_465924 [Hypoxylon sp. FL1150]